MKFGISVTGMLGLFLTASVSWAQLCIKQAPDSGPSGRLHNLYDSYSSTALGEDPHYRKVWTGASLEILDSETFYFQGTARQGVKIKILTNDSLDCVKVDCSDVARPGEILWADANLLECR